MAEDDGALPTWILELRPLTSVVGYLADLGRQIRAAGGDPVAWLRKNVLGFIVGGILGIAFNVAEFLGTVFDPVVASFDVVAQSLIGRGGAFPLLGDAVGGVQGFIEGTGTAAASQLGIAAPFVVIPLYLLVIALIIRAIPPTLVAASDLLGSVPVIGSVLDALATFAIEYAPWTGD